MFFPVPLFCFKNVALTECILVFENFYLAMNFGNLRMGAYNIDFGTNSSMPEGDNIVLTRNTQQTIDVVLQYS